MDDLDLYQIEDELNDQEQKARRVLLDMVREGRPPGCVTVREAAEDAGISRGAARWRLERLVEAGEAERIELKYSDGVYYRLIEESE